ncbi:MAG: Gfo/Idh/MocA family oxidoreductase [Kiritimatiellia bacterium]|jgi:predicted dehydrogenase|nr:Gfo/Idh/MocA family oxidoreductase [Kiritimatiellia bacterium]MDD4173721.1 Gfo/Idh/MocA family oxidoreductase [Kiritimatiellia bacterium]MDD4441318.1 Gfo/Idh/MocA family oxidoreductase [Kiritimatiellia bacterium]MDX9792488.1 Gfo/Idh/MocA family oxidoreductase [Kiritimatiellia bacterium]NLC80184.1 Gfo/Idh/MocA family oxidoreductase [Lentisphaerota bacterium]
MQNRREFIKGSSVFAAMMAAAPTVSMAQNAPRVFKVGMIGAGGRCSGAMAQIIEAAKNLGHQVKLVAVCDFFEDRAKGAAKKFGCDEKNAFWDANSYKKVVASDCEIIVTATPPNFRPVHVEAAIKAGKHVFAEKPVAVDGPGLRQFLAAAKLAKEKNLALVAGSQRRHQKGYLLQALALQQGKVGQVLGGAVYWNGTVPWVRARKEGMKNDAYLCSNWVNWTEMSGDHIVEQHVHNLDVANWFIGRYPRTAGAFGGRARRVSGNQYDFFGVDFDYGDGIHIHSQCRQIGGTSGFVGERFRTEQFEISGGGKIQKVGGEALKLEGDTYTLNGNTYAIKDGNPYVIEHENLLRGILGQIPLMNEGESIAMGTACAIIGRISAYTGQTVRMSDVIENQNSPYYNLVCKPTWQEFEAGDVAMPEYGDDQAPLPGKPWGK